MPAYRIKTDRLLIRCYEPGDATALKSAIDESLDHLLQWLPWAKNEPEELDKKIQRIRRNRAAFDLDENYVYGIFLPDEAKLIGSIAAKGTLGENAREIGYWLHKDYIGCGYVSEASSALIKAAFEIEKVERVEIHCDEKNLKSSAIPRRLGFSREAAVRVNEMDSNGIRIRHEIWMLFRDEYEKTDIVNFKLEAFDAIGRRIL